MKDCLGNINRIFLLAIAGIQSICAIVWLGTKIRDGRVSWLSLFAMIVLLTVLGRLIFKNKKMWILAVIFVFTMPQVLDTAISEGHIAGLPDAPKGNVSQLAVQRFAWPFISEMGYTYYLDIIDDAEVLRLSLSPEKLWDTFYPAASEAFGDFAPSVYNRFTETSLQTYKRRILPAIIKDFCTYFVTPVSMELSSWGLLESNNSEYFDNIIGDAGALGRFYLHFGFVSFLLTVILAIISMAVNKSLPRKRTIIGLAVLITVISLYNILCPLRGFDYRNGVLITILWSYFLVYAMRDVNADC